MEPGKKPNGISGDIFLDVSYKPIEGQIDKKREIAEAINHLNQRGNIKSLNPLTGHTIDVFVELEDIKGDGEVVNIVPEGIYVNLKDKISFEDNALAVKQESTHEYMVIRVLGTEKPLDFRLYNSRDAWRRDTV